mmetsp:Transcript_29752/g.60780  ORF Transcript_29752/g.60780 Transcript_29752/m.60780 type:complete len:482 (-) Transcript_29752:275-1720(-)
MSSEDRSSPAGKPKADDKDDEKQRPTSILPQSMPSPNMETLLPPEPQSHYSNSPYELGQANYDMQTPTPGHYEYGRGRSMYPQMHSYMSPYAGLDPQGSMRDTAGQLGPSGVFPCSSSYSTGAPVTAFSVLPPPLDSSTSSMPIMPPHGSHPPYTPPMYGYGSGTSAYSGSSLRGGYRDMQHQHHPHHPYSSPMIPTMSPQSNLYDGTTTVPSGMGSQSASAAAQLSSGYAGMGHSPMYGSGVGTAHYPYTSHGYPEQYARHGRGSYSHARDRGGEKGGSQRSTGGGIPRAINNPGPPIVTSRGQRQGPHGANLYIFYIPNDYTNQEMYDLFAPYGNILSVRIMVDSDTGRSRGFGFVSYDSVASAASAIADLNGLAIRGKRLKVQHKSIKGSYSPYHPQDMPGPDSGRASPMYPIDPHTSVLPPAPPDDTDQKDSLSQRKDQQDASQNSRLPPPPRMNRSTSSPMDNLGDLRNALPDPDP